MSVNRTLANKEKTISLKPLIAGMVIQLVFFVFHISVGIWTQAGALEVNSYFLFLSAGFWLLAIIHTQLRKKANEEKNELLRVETLRKERGAKSALFQNNELTSGSFQQNIIKFEKYFLPVLSFLFSAIVMYFGYQLYREYQFAGQESPKNIFKASAFTASISFLLLITGLYLRGLAKDEYSYMRGPATITLTCSALSLVESAALIAFTSGWIESLNILFIVSAILVFSVGFELLLNTFLYLIKPVHKEEIQLPPYDSRVFLLLTSTGSAWKSLNGMIDYQFGFRISESWVFQTLLKLVLPFVAFQVCAGLICTSFVIIRSGQAGLVERFGQPLNNGIGLEPGLHFKFPWPIDSVTKVDTSQIITVEAGHKKDDHDKIDPAQKATLNHYRETDLFVVKKKSNSGKEDYLELISISAVFQFHANPQKLLDYLYHYDSMKDSIEMLIHSELSVFLSEKIIDGSLSDQIGPWNKEFAERFNNKLEKVMPGIVPVYLTLQNIHVPVELSESVNEIFIASEKKKISIYKSESEAIKLETQTVQEVLSLQSGQRQAIYRLGIEAVDETKRITNLKEVFKNYGAVFMQREWLEFLEKTLSNAEIDFVSKQLKINLEDGEKGVYPLANFTQ